MIQIGVDNARSSQKPICFKRWVKVSTVGKKKAHKICQPLLCTIRCIFNSPGLTEPSVSQCPALGPSGKWRPTPRGSHASSPAADARGRPLRPAPARQPATLPSNRSPPHRPPPSAATRSGCDRAGPARASPRAASPWPASALLSSALPARQRPPSAPPRRERPGGSDGCRAPPAPHPERSSPRHRERPPSRCRGPSITTPPEAPSARWCSTIHARMRG